MDFDQFFRIVANITNIIKNVNEIFPAARRQKALADLRIFADSEAGQKTNDVLILLAGVGILIIGFLQSLLVFLAKNCSKEGLYYGLITFTVFMVAALWYFNLRGKK